MNAIISTSLLFALFIGTTLAQETNTITYGSAVKLVHKESSHLLHSHIITWGSGSGQQSVTSTDSKSDPGSLWVVRGPSHSSVSFDISTPIMCGSVISLEHATTGKILHSHLFKAPLSGNQEVSGFHENDTGNNWIVECEGKDKYWTRGHVVSFRHVDTSKYLSTSDQFKFTQMNCGMQCPIMVSLYIFIFDILVNKYLYILYRSIL